MMSDDEGCMFGDICEIRTEVKTEVVKTEVKTVTYKINNKKFPETLKDKTFFTLNIKLENNKKVAKFPKGWSDIEKPRYNEKHNALALLTGRKNNLYVIDYDNDLNFKVDSELFPELKTYYEKTRKGFHCYFQYDKLADKLGNQNIKEKDIDFLGNGRCVFSSPTMYKSTDTPDGAEHRVELLNGDKIEKMSVALYNHLSSKYIKSGAKPEHVDEKVDEAKVVKIKIKPLPPSNISKLMNKIYGVKFNWEVEKKEGYKNSFIIYAADNFSCIATKKHTHHEVKHSSIFVCKKYIKCQCFSHDDVLFIDSFPSNLEEAKKNEQLIKQCLGITKDKKKKDEEQKVKLNDYQVLLNFLWEDAKKNKYKKEEGFILKPHPKIPTFYEEYMEYNDYLNMLFSNKEHPTFWMYRKTSKIIHNLMDYLEKYNDIEIPFIKRNKNYASYLNGVFDMKKMEFKKWGEHDCVCSSVMFSENFDSNWLNVKFNKISTPVFDKLIKYQIKSNIEYKMFLVMTGRLLFDVGELDNWQCMMYIHGEGNTGKGTFIELIKCFFQNSGILSSTFEKTFGLQNLFDKEVIIAPDLPKKIDELLDGACLQSMISGEGVSVAVKNKKAKQVSKWKPPMLWCGNFLPNYDDNGGSISRRFAIFKMTTPVSKKDTRLIAKLKSEAYITLVKILSAYHFYLNKIGEVSFDKWGDELNIKCFEKGKDDLKKESSLLFQYLTLDPSSNKTKNSHKYFIFKEGCSVSLEKVKKQFKFFLKFKHPNKFKNYKWSSTIEESVLKSLGYMVVSKRICAVCIDAKNCNPCHQNNKRKIKIVENMELFDADDINDCDFEEI